jgi:hypothetical protein
VGQGRKRGGVLGQKFAEALRRAAGDLRDGVGHLGRLRLAQECAQLKQVFDQPLGAPQRAHPVSHHDRRRRLVADPAAEHIAHRGCDIGPRQRLRARHFE